MDLQELRNRMAHWAGLTASNADPDFNSISTTLLNAAQVRYGRRLFVPRSNLLFSGVGTPTITLPDTPYHNGIISVFDVSNGRRLPVFDVYTADNEYPDRANMNPGLPEFVEYDYLSSPNVLRLWPAPSTAIDIRVFFAFMPQLMRAGTDQPWNGQFPEYHEIIALSAALDYVERRLGEDALDRQRDENPYGPLNAPNWLRKKLAEMESEVQANVSVLVRSVPTANRRLGFRNSGYRWTR